MKDDWPASTEADVVAMLAGHPLTDPLGDDARSALAPLATVVDLDPGEVLVEQGQPGDAAYLVIAGRMAATVNGIDMGMIGRGETVGEMSLITGEPRSATITARRSCRLLRIGADDFASVVASHPEVHRRLTALLVERLRGTLLGHPAWVGHATVVGIAASGADDTLDFCRRLERAIAGQGGRASLVEPDPERAAGPDLYDLETTSDVVLVATDIDQVATGARSFDRTLLVVDANGPMPDIAPGRVTDLVLRHPRSTELPSGTRRWLDALEPESHHHLRVDSNRGIDRLARRLLRRERVLVLGGGGARGLAHLGTYQALVELGIDCDAVVGASAGALFGAGVALDWTPQKSIDQAAAMLIEGRGIVDFTVPMVALSSGRRMTERIRTGLGAHVDLEDLWLPLTCISADLASLSVRLDRRGPLWRAVRASVSVPGVFPPLLIGDAVLVDGGVVDNLPVARARQLHPGATIISSDVGRRHEPLNVDLPSGGIVGGWQTTWNRVGRRRETPSLVKLLYRLTALGGGAVDSDKGDVHLEHVLDGIGLFDFAGARPAIAAGYERTMAVLADPEVMDRLGPRAGPLAPEGARAW